MVLIIILIVVFIVFLYFLFRKKKIQVDEGSIPSEYKEILQNDIDFYKRLTEDERNTFDQRLISFLKTKRIVGVECEIEAVDVTLIACGALIPVFRFPEYFYPDLNEILIYPNRFDKNYQFKGSDLDVLGMVGHGNEMRGTMILSQKALRQGFKNQIDGRNVAIHEFVHLIDGDDRSIDGLPEALLSNQQTIPFLKLIHNEMKKVEENKSILDPYAGENEAEFFAVASELYFENPEKMEKHHPLLYQMLKQVFKSI